MGQNFEWILECTYGYRKGDQFTIGGYTATVIAETEEEAIEFLKEDEPGAQVNKVTKGKQVEAHEEE